MSLRSAFHNIVVIITAKAKRFIFLIALAHRIRTGIVAFFGDVEIAATTFVAKASLV